MPVHDWTRVSAGTFHDFHHAWIAEIRTSLNKGLLPDGFYALAEQRAGATAPDVLTLEEVIDPLAEQGYTLPEPDADEKGGADSGGGLAVAEAPPKATVIEMISEAALLTLKQKRIAIYHATDDRVVALLEIVSPGNKDGRGPIRAFVDKAQAALQQGYHLMVIDVLPPVPAAPAMTLHNEIWRPLGGTTYVPKPGKPLMLSSYQVAKGVTAYVEPVGVEDVLPSLPLFYTSENYVNAPLEATYMAAYEGVPRRWKRVIEAAT